MLFNLFPVHFSTKVNVCAFTSMSEWYITWGGKGGEGPWVGLRTTPTESVPPTTELYPQHPVFKNILYMDL